MAARNSGNNKPKRSASQKAAGGVMPAPAPLIEEYLTPEELRKKIPDCPWNPQQLGMLIHLRLLDGKKIGRTCIIHPRSLKALMKLIKKSFRSY